MRELKAINDTYKTKCDYLESELSRQFESVKQLNTDVQEKDR